MESLPETLRHNPQFVRYFEIWREHEASMVFVPLAQILRDGGYLQEAADVCEKSLPHNPDSISGRLLLASIYWDLAKYDQADRLAREILERMPEHPEAIRYMHPQAPSPQKTSDPLVTKTMADILIEQGAYGDAAVVLRQLIASHPESRDLRERLAEIEELLTGEEKTVT